MAIERKAKNPVGLEGSEFLAVGDAQVYLLLEADQPRAVSLKLDQREVTRRIEPRLAEQVAARRHRLRRLNGPAIY
jgi:hypothetical protein